jgi:hypothetical protein
MECVDFGVDIRICRCTGCHGLFCNMNTLAKMRDEWLTDTVLDIGDANRGAQFNHMTDVPCPECGTIMEHHSDDEQTHITLDICPYCTGVILDAGELTDMKSVTLMDHVRRLLTMLGR